MKKTIQKLFHKFGYHASRLMPEKGPFVDLKKLCNHVDSPTIFDVGAHHGWTTKEFRSRFPNSRIFSFEPFPESFEYLKGRVEGDSETRIFNFGFSDHVGPAKFYSNSCPSTNSLLATDEIGTESWGEGLLETQKIVQAQFKTIDIVLDELDIQKIDILKLDVQGAEHRVLNGAIKACRERLIGMIYSEIITIPTYIGQKTVHELLSVFYDSGFEIYNIYNLCSRVDGQLQQFDVIFIPANGC